MAKIIKQYRYYSDGNPNNQPAQNLTKDKICGIISIDNPYRDLYFQDKIIYQLGIQAIPGTKFYINGSTEPAIIGINGYFQINQNSDFIVNTLRFDEKSIKFIEKNPAALLIIDTIEEEGS